MRYRALRSRQRSLFSGRSCEVPDINTCSNCAHKLGCYGRIALEALIRDFKLLAMDRDEQIECGCAANIDNLRAVLAGACTGYIREGTGGVRPAGKNRFGDPLMAERKPLLDDQRRCGGDAFAHKCQTCARREQIVHDDQNRYYPFMCGQPNRDGTCIYWIEEVTG